MWTVIILLVGFIGVYRALETGRQQREVMIQLLREIKQNLKEH